MQKIALILGMFSFFSLIADTSSLSPHMDLIYAVRQLDYSKVSQLLEKEKALPAELQNGLIREIDTLIEKEKKSHWSKGFANLIVGIPLSIISLRFLNKAYEHNVDREDSLKELARRFIKVQPTKVAVAREGTGVYVTNLPLVAVAGFLSAVGAQAVLKGITSFFSGESKNYFKALAMKSLIENKVVFSKKKLSVQWDPSIFETDIQS